MRNKSEDFVVLYDKMTNQDKQQLRDYLDMTISSQAPGFFGQRVQRLSGDTEYRPNAIGSGSAKHPKWMKI